MCWPRPSGWSVPMRHNGNGARREASQYLARVADTNGVSVVPPDVDEVPVKAWPAPPAPAAFTGLAGHFVKAIEDHSEGDPVAVLTQLLVAFGNAIGRGPHFIAGADRHGMNLFALVIGRTASGR